MIDRSIGNEIISLLVNSDDYVTISPSVSSFKDDDIVVFRNIQTGSVRVAEVGSISPSFFRSSLWEKFGVFRPKPKRTPEPVEVGTIARFSDIQRLSRPYFFIKSRGGGSLAYKWAHVAIEPGTIPPETDRYYSWDELVSTYGNPTLVNPYRPSTVREDGTY